MSTDATVRTRGGDVVTLRVAQPNDHLVLHRLFNDTVAVTGGYPQAVPIGEEEFLDYWVRGKTEVVVAEVEEAVVGSYFLKPNHPGRGAHIANAGYLVDRRRQRRGVGRRLVEHSLQVARERGFRAMQFNLVFASNPARRMYEEFGFRVVGRLPRAIEGEDALIYWLELPTD